MEYVSRGQGHVVGPRWRETPQGYSHWLRNSLSGQSLHVLQIRREYLKRPMDAREASHEKVRLTSQLRAASAEGGTLTAALMRPFDVCNGTVELHEWSMGSDKEEAALNLAREHASASRWQEALQLLGEQLAMHPLDSQAHALRGTLFVECADCNAAHHVFCEAIKIEPKEVLNKTSSSSC